MPTNPTKITSEEISSNVEPASTPSAAGKALISDGAGNTPWEVPDVPLAPAATNVAGGVANDIPYQTAASTTSFIAAPGANVILTGNSAAPVWTAASSVTFGSATTAGTVTTAAQTAITSLGTQAAVLNMGGFQINNVANPTLAQDAATKAYADAIAGGLIWLAPISDPCLADGSLAYP